MEKYNALEGLKEISDEQIKYVVTSLNSNNVITDLEKPFIVYYQI